MRKENNMAIKTEGLCFGFRKGQPILKGLDIQVKQGSIYGFLGPNGSGKTTTIRILLGLLKADKGLVSIFGDRLGKSRREILCRVGALIEQPSLYEHLTGFDNLEIVRQLEGLPVAAARTALERVRLREASHKVVKAYSLGMKQRLGIAIALLGDPELLVLDEPVNGLDPAGMVDIRNLLKEINSTHGTTIFISSHLLSEMEKLASDVGIINMGQMLFQGTVKELEALQPQARCLHIETGQPEAALKLIDTRFTARMENGELLVDVPSRDGVNPVLQLLIDAGIEVFSVTDKARELESWFLRMTEHHVVR